MPWSDDLHGDALDIAASDASPLRVRADPVTGKTFTLMRRIARFLEQGAEPRQILVCPFTWTAAADLKEAVVVLNAPGSDSVKTPTIHSRCFGIPMRDDVLASTARAPRPLLEFGQRFLLEDLRGDGFGTIHDKRKRLKAFEVTWARLQDEQPGWPNSATDRAL